MNYDISTIYDTIQGEGVLTGTPMTFIRLAGCTVGCPFCDTKESWGSGRILTTKDILSRVNQKWVCVTGGEPFEQDLMDLLIALKGVGHSVAVETSGTKPILDYRSRIDHLCVSPKEGFLPETLMEADEIKWIVGKLQDVTLAQASTPTSLWKKISLQPMSQTDEALDICIDACLKYGYKLSVQVHKYIGIN